jgi:hypothetical protein
LSLFGKLNSLSLYGRGIKGEGNKKETNRENQASPSLVFPPMKGGKNTHSLS